MFASFSDPRQIWDKPLLLFPAGFNLDSYAKVFENSEIWSGYANTLLYALVGTAINIMMTVFGAYPLSRKRFYGKGLFTLLFAFTMFFSGGLIPLYLVNKELGLLNTMWALVLPGAISAYNMIIMRTYFQTRIPVELEERLRRRLQRLPYAIPNRAAFVHADHCRDDPVLWSGPLELVF